MDRFVVPQFLDVEDKILGPITIRQFLIMLSAGLLIFVSYRLADFVLFIILTIFLSGLALVFAFIKINGQPFHYFILNLSQHFSRPGQRVWRKDYEKSELDYLRKTGFEKEDIVAPSRKPAKKRHIRDLSLIVNTGGYYPGEGFGQKQR